MRQSEKIRLLSDSDLKKSLYASQLIFSTIAISIGIFLFENVQQWLALFQLDIQQLFFYGLFPGLIIVTIDIFMYLFVPKAYYDDGGINERIFGNMSVMEIGFVALLVAFSEELLFRGIVQTTFGYWLASTFFALVHVRYLTKPVLFVSIIFVSFFIGYIFVITGNLLVTITIHFIVDFLLGIFIRFSKRGG